MGIRSTIPGTAVVVLNDSRTDIVLHLRDDWPMWSLPGGRPEFGESISQTVVRETREETGLDVAIQRLIGIYSDPDQWIFSYPDGNVSHAFAAAFECVVVSGTLMPNGDDSLDVKWFPLDALPGNLMPMHGAVIRDAVSHATGVIA